MGAFNIPADEQEALLAIERGQLSTLIEQAIQKEQSIDLRRYLARCGSFVSGHLHSFEQALDRHRQAKAAYKREQTASDLRCAGYKLSSAVEAMQRRVEEEREDGKLFFVDDHIWPPHRFDKALSVRVSYRWRRTVDDPWTDGSIIFNHQVELRPNYAIPAPRRKPSKAKQEQDLQNTLYQTWEYLMRGACDSVWEFLKAGGDGAQIPKTFTATVNAHSRDLNNYSTQFWRDQPTRSARSPSEV